MGTTWLTKKGVRISVRQMSDDHLLNAIRMLERKGKEMKKVMEDNAFNIFVSTGNEMEANEMEKIYDKLHDMKTADFLAAHTEYSSLLEESRRRKLY